MVDLRKIATEQRNPRTTHIDELSTLEMVKLINSEDHKVAEAVEAVCPQIAKAVDVIAEKLREGGRLIYVGCGTSGRLGILDAVECPPTYSTEPEMVQGLIAGGMPAIYKAVEGAEDDRELGAEDLKGIRFSEKDVLDAMDSDNTFRSLYGEVQRLLGRSLNTEELKILLGFVRYLGLTADVISLLVCYCKERARQRGSLRNPSLRTIEKEAYNWAERGIDTVEEAAAFIQAQNVRNSRLSRLMNLIQIRGRSLTAAEERYAQSWLDMGMDDELISMAYERTCLNTGGLNWAYMNKILQRWQQQGFHSAEDVRTGDRKTGVPKGASGQLGEAELEAIQKVLQEG